MRGFSIFIWCLVTALMFYSAWRFKAPEIETDVLTRVTENVHQSGGNKVAVEVDGRHVNLRGFASSPSQKADLLETADTTYGALGPIDGLMLPTAPTRTFLSATRTQNGVALSGVVGSAEERDALITQAKTAGLGNVTDDLVVADGQIGWTKSATLGFSQLAALSTGHLYVSDDRQALSGTAPTTEVATAASALGDGWQSYVAGPAIEDPRIAELTGSLAMRDGKITELEAQMADQTSQITRLDSDLATTRENLANLQSQNAGLETKLSQKEAHITLLTRDTKAKSLNLQDISGQSDRRAARIAELEAELAANAGDATAMEAKLAATAASLALLRNNGGEQTAGLEQALAEKTAEVAELEAELVALSSAKDAKIAELDGQLAALTEAQTQADATIAGLTSEKSALEAQRNAQATRLTTANQSLDAERSAKEAQIASLQAELDAAQNDVTAKATTITTLQAELDKATASISETEQLQRDATQRGDDLDAIVADQSRQIASLSEERDTLAARVSDLEGTQEKLGSLEASVSEKDAKITELMASLAAVPDVSEPQTAATCNETAKALLDGGNINFVTNSADIVETSEPLLERITGVVLACSGPESGASVTVAGHTDSRGSDDANQALSEARAQSVASFMIERGVDPKALQPVGFGETQPIADNETTEGRALNRRISFDFQARN